MQRTQDLYGVSPSHFDGMTIRETSKEKIMLARHQIDELLKVHYTERNMYRLKVLEDAIAHHEYLLSEE